MWVGTDPELFPNCSLLDWEDKADREKMGSSMCSRRQKKIFQTLFFLTIVFGFLYGLLLYYEMHNQLKKAENLSLKYQQHQEALSAQLQVVYEHRSRLEKSLQKERNEHKKAKEDYLVYKLEAQESLNKEKQDSNSRFSALSVQHKMLKSQHEDLRKQYTDLHGEHVRLGEDHGRAMNEHSRQYLSLQQSKEQEIAKLKENIYNLFEENKKLRRAHQDVHVQLQDVRQLHKNLLVQHDQLQVTLEDHKNSLSVAQAQVEEYKQLRETLNKMPSLRQSEQKPPSFNEHGPHQGVADPRPYQERQGERGQVPYRADDKEREGEPSHIKPTVEEDDVPETRGGGGEEVGRQHPQHENWHRNPQPAEAEAEGEQTEEEGREHGEWEREDKDHAVDQRDVHGQPDEGEAAESHPPDGQDVGNVEDERTEEHDQPTNRPSEKKYKSPYEEQLEQQRLAELREEEARRLKERQDALHQQRLREYMDRQQRMQQEEKRKEELARQEQFRRRADYHHDDATAETEDEHGAREEEEEEEEEADEDHNHHEEADDQDPEIVNEQHQTEHEALKQQIDGNPDQQEDNLDEQYQDEEEADEKERGANEQEEEPVVEDPNQGEEKEDENYEEEPEEEDGEEDGEALAVKTNQRAEM